MGDYRRATGFEALIGLYLTGQEERMLTLIQIWWRRMYKDNKREYGRKPADGKAGRNGVGRNSARQRSSAGKKQCQQTTEPTVMKRMNSMKQTTGTKRKK